MDKETKMEIEKLARSINDLRESVNDAIIVNNSSMFAFRMLGIIDGEYDNKRKAFKPSTCNKSKNKKDDNASDIKNRLSGREIKNSSIITPVSSNSEKIKTFITRLKLQPIEVLIALMGLGYIENTSLMQYFHIGSKISVTINYFYYMVDENYKKDIFSIPVSITPAGKRRVTCTGDSELMHGGSFIKFGDIIIDSTIDVFIIEYIMTIHSNI